MRRLPTADKSREVREAFIAGASIADTPSSASSWAVVYRWPGQQRAANEVSGRVPMRSVASDPLFPEKRPSEIFPGTVLAAEWFACLAAVRIAISDRGPSPHDATGGLDHDDDLDDEMDHEPLRAMPAGPIFLPIQPGIDAFPLRLCTTRRDIVDFLAGRTPLSQRPWLRELQDDIAAMIECRVAHMGKKRFIRPSDRPYPGKKPRGLGFLPVYGELIPHAKNLRASRVSRVALKAADRPETPQWW